MTTILLDSPRGTPTTMTDALLLLPEEDRAGLWRSVDRIAGAAFCSPLHSTVATFARQRVADHFGLPDDLVDVMITTRLLGLATRLTWELDFMA